MSKSIDRHAQMMYEASANSPITWQSVAYELVAAGNLCFRRYERLNRGLATPHRPVRYYQDVSARSFFMLYAFALEAMLKAVWLAQGNRAVSPSTTGLEKAFKRDGHDLRKWWDRALIAAPTADELLMLEFLTSFVEIGRYPVRARAQSADNRLILPSAARPVIISMLDKALGALPKGPGVLRPRLATLGVRRTPVRMTNDGVHAIRRPKGSAGNSSNRCRRTCDGAPAL